MSGSTYFLEIVSNKENVDGEYDIIALVHGSLKVVNFVGTDALKDLAALEDQDAEYSLEFTETERLGSTDDPKRTVTRVTSDAGTVASVLKDKLKKERAQAKDATASSTTASGEGQPTPLVAEKVAGEVQPDDGTHSV